MLVKKFAFPTPAVLFCLVLISSAPSFAQVETVLYTFLGGKDGSNPDCALVADSAGNLYGTVPSSPFGEVFELSPPATPGDAWTKTVIHKFGGGPNDGENWPAATLTFDKLGNLYAVAGYGGTNGTGIIFELSPSRTAGGTWHETVLYNFPAGYTYGKPEYPGGRLTFDGAGNLYGTAAGGVGNCFSNGCGTVFQLKRPATTGGAWRLRVIYAFGAYAGDAIVPESGFLFRSGVLYGATALGGANGQGTLYELSQSNGVWTETILHSFTAAEGSQIMGNLIGDPDGNIYTVAYAGGKIGYGSVVELSPPAVPGDPWQATNLHSFTYGNDGGSPQSGVVRDSAGNLYGTAANGAFEDSGTVFKLIPPAVAGGRWTEKTLHKFSGLSGDGDGAEPYAGLILVNGSGLFGTTHYGGVSGTSFIDNGTVFNLKP